MKNIKNVTCAMALILLSLSASANTNEQHRDALGINSQQAQALFNSFAEDSESTTYVSFGAALYGTISTRLSGNTTCEKIVITDDESNPEFSCFLQ